MRNWASPAVGLLLVVAAPATADGTTLEDALALARERAPALLAARARVAEAEGERRGATAPLAENPVLEVAAGPRRSSDGDTTDYEIALSQDLDAPGSRSARIAAADARVDARTARHADAERTLLRDVAIVFWRAVAARERLLLASADAADAQRTSDAVRRRVELGDAPALEENAARIARARARAAEEAGAAAHAETVGALRTLLGLDEQAPLEPDGALGARRAYDLDGLLASVSGRPDLLVAAAELARAEADLRLARSAAWPELGATLSYAREEGDRIALAGVRAGLPLFARGQGDRAAAAARVARLRHQLAARKLAAATEVRVAWEKQRRQVEAVAILERDALPALADNDDLARRSYEAGELGLLDWLALRREAVAARLDHVDRRLAASEAAAELEAAAGVLR